jgi:hypothetical protein
VKIVENRLNLTKLKRSRSGFKADFSPPEKLQNWIALHGTIHPLYYKYKRTFDNDATAGDEMARCSWTCLRRIRRNRNSWNGRWTGCAKGLAHIA